MRLFDALRLEPGMTVAFTGAGGKSTALETLARESRGRIPFVATTTTRLAASQAKLAGRHLVDPDPGAVGEALQQKQASLLVTGPLDVGELKWTALPMGRLESLRTACLEAGAVLAIEADGARGKWIKAPAAHEPVVPTWADVVAPILGMHPLGKPLGSEVAHRPELVAEVLGIRQGEILEEDHLAGLMTSPAGGLKGVADAAEVRVLLTQGDDEERAAVRVGESILAAPRVRAVLIGSREDGRPVRKMIGRVAGVVLAAGAGTRLGRLKPLVEWKGEPLALHVVRAARAGGLRPIVVVLGAEANHVRSALAGEDVILVDNAEWSAGQSSSVRAGLAAVEGDVEAAAFLLCDMPRVSPATIQRLILRHGEKLAAAVAPVDGGRRGNPVLFDRRLFAELKALTGDQGGRAVLEGVPWEAVEADAAEFFDVDEPSDLEALRRMT